MAICVFVKALYEWNITIHQKEIPVYIQMSLAIKYPYILASFTS